MGPDLLLCHASPDGDTLGSATALCRGLRALGKTVNIDCADPIPEKFQYLFEGLPQEEREPRYIVTVDVADVKLLGAAWNKWVERADLAIDHHGAREVFAPLRWVEPDSAATAEMIFLLLEELGAPVDPATAGCVYTGIATDTGCFRYRNVTPRDPPHRRQDPGAGGRRRRDQPADVREQVPGPGGGRAPGDGGHGVPLRGKGRHDPGALEDLGGDRHHRKADLEGPCLPAPADPRGGGGHHLKGAGRTAR